MAAHGGLPGAPDRAPARAASAQRRLSQSPFPLGHALTTARQKRRRGAQPALRFPYAADITGDGR